MIYPDNFEEKVGFDTVRQLLGEKCLSVPGQELVEAIAFSADVDVVTEWLNQTDEFVRILQGDREFPADGYMDVREALARTRPEGTHLDEAEVFDLKRSLQTIYTIVRFFHVPDGDVPVYPTLTKLAGDVPVFPQLVRLIDDMLDKYGRMKDSASPQLAEIRKDLRNTTGSISRQLQQILRAAQTEGLVEKDATPAMRDGRLVIPVAPAFKRKIRGIVHDESASGKTVFIEPEAVVEANNRIRELEHQEKREIIRILTQFTDTVRPLVPEILHASKFLARMDFIRAKALFAAALNAVKPQLTSETLIDWTEALHPLLLLSHKKLGKTVEALDINLHKQQRILVISGPNAGGKSVCLKTVGLLQYMVQCGLLVTMNEKSSMGVFKKILIDIGDEQSIENDLSTYSSHLANMKWFLKQTDDGTLFLIDEFGSGTEPMIGGAIAESLLERFNKNNGFGIVTTHYQNLKQFAAHTEGIVNGAMLYDRHRMQPLFKLTIGRPGGSFAVEIARKIGLPEDLIADATSKVGSEYVHIDKYLQDIARDKRYWENKRQDIRKQEKQLENLTTKYTHDLDTLKTQRKEIIKEAKQQAQTIVSSLNARIENTIREIREAQADKARTKEARQALEQFIETTLADTEGEILKQVGSADLTGQDDRDEHAAVRREAGKKGGHTTFCASRRILNQVQDDGDGRQAKEEYKVGDAVEVRGEKVGGVIVEVKGKEAVVAMGDIKVVVKLEKLQRTDKGKVNTVRKQTQGYATAEQAYQRKLNFKTDIDIRGMRANDALQTIVYFIDDALQTNTKQVRILHGTGNGVLRQVVRDYLKTVQNVKFGDELLSLGGTGITVVQLEI